MDPRSQASPPSADQLEAATLELARRGELRLLVSTVERWSQVGAPTPRARLAQIEALLDLRVMDKAWTRLQAIPEDSPDALRRWKLTARMFVERGWPNRAREAVEQATALAPDDAEVQALAAASLEPPRNPPAHLPPAESPFEERLAVAETLLACGAFLKARRMLDVLDQERPGDRRVSDLLWALQGDYELVGATLQQVVSHYAVPPRAADPATGTPVVVTRNRGSGARDGAFPALFRGPASDRDRADSEAETTMATRMEDIRRAPSLPDLDRDDDTAVLRVVGDDLTDADAGVAPPSARPEDVEEEDDVVVMVRRRDLQAPPETRRPMPLPPAARRPDRRKKTPVPQELDLDMAEIEDLDALDELELDSVSPHGATDDFPYGWLIASAVVLAVSGLALGAAIVWTSLHPAP